VKPLRYKRQVEVREALKRTVRQYTIDGVSGFDPKSFIDEVRSTVIDLLTEIRQVYFVLSCIMERVYMKSGAVGSL